MADGELAGGPLLIEEVEGKGRGLVVSVEVEDRVEAVTLCLKVVGFGGQSGPALGKEHAGARESRDDEGG